MNTKTQGLREELLRYTIDYDCTNIPDAGEPMNGLTCGLLRRVAAALNPAIAPAGADQPAADDELPTTTFVDGLGWVVPCRYARKYVRTLDALLASEMAAQEAAK